MSEIDAKAPARKPGFLGRLRSWFLTGLLVTAPVLLTVYITWAAIELIDGQVASILPGFNQLVFANIPGAGLIIGLILITFIGAVAAGFLGRWLIGLGESILNRMPVVRTIYGASKQDALARLCPSVPTLLFPAWDCLPFDRLSPQNALTGQRVAALARLADGQEKGAGGGQLLVTTVNAIMQRVPPIDYFSERSLALSPGDAVGPSRLAEFLSSQGYLRTDTVRETGEFALRGGIVDIFPPGNTVPVRLDFFGDELETIRSFDAATQRGAERRDGLVLRPVAEFQLDADTVERFRTGYRAAFGAMASRDALYESVSAARMHPGVEHWLPLFHEKMDLLTDYCAGWQLVLDHEVDGAVAARQGQIADFHAARIETPEKFCRRNTVRRESVDSLHILCNWPNSIPCGCGLIASTLEGSLSVTLGQW